MSSPGFIEIMLIAMGAQLAVLPGEKVQFLISGLSTHYNPVVVVSAAGTAFAGWTAVEIMFGKAIQGALPPTVLNVITAGMFLLFAILLFRSMPDQNGNAVDTDGGQIAAIENFELPVVGKVPEFFGGFLPIFGTMAAGEFGDKTQLITISLAVQYGAHPAIWVGEMLAIIPVSIANAVFFYKFSNSFNVRKAHMFGAGVFAFFGLDTILKITTGISIWENLVGFASDLILGLL